MEVGLKAVEFELDANLPHWAQFEPLMDACHALGLVLCFHAPYRPPHTIAGFDGSRRQDIVEDYTPMLSLANSWAGRQAQPVRVVVHPAKSSTAQAGARHEALTRDTLAFLTWALEAFPGLHFAVENMNRAKPGEVRVGTTRPELAALAAKFDPARLGICWDFGHDALCGRFDLPDPAFLARVAHVHVHDLDAGGLDHYPLVFGRVPAADWLRALARSGLASSRAAVASLELKGSQLSGWPLEETHRALLSSLRLIRRSTV